MSSTSAWIKAARLRTLPLALSCTLVGATLALQHGVFGWSIFALSILTTILLQVLSNFANDYGDFKNGADLIKGRGDRMLSSGQITESSMKTGLILTSVLSFLSGIALIFVSFGFGQILPVLFMIALGLAAIWAALKYTAGSNPYGYRGLGDVFVFLFFGLVGVLGTQFLYQQSVNLDSIPYALLIGFLSVAVLNLNNLRDIETDALANKITIPVRLGFKKAKQYHFALLIMAWLSLTFVITQDFNSYKLIVILPVLLQVKHLSFVIKCTEPQLLDTELKKVALSTFFIGVLLFLISTGLLNLDSYFNLDCRAIN
jgi:1,4-dihydroxy-2-naphthoate polyprenyltransferase